MKQRNKFLTMIFAASMLALLIICGCGSEMKSSVATDTSGSDKKIVQATKEPEQTEAPVVTPAPTPVPTPGPLSIKWDPYVWGSIHDRAFTKSVKKTAMNYIRAVMNGKKTFKVVKAEELSDVEMAMHTVNPVVAKIASASITNNPHVAKLSYNVSDKKRKKMIKNFGKEVEKIIRQCVYEDDSETIAAMVLYESYSNMIEYDHAAIEGDSLVADVTPYRAIMDKEGICQSFASAYAHLLLQVGIDSTCAGSLNYDNTVAHEWTLVKLDGKYYYMDPTYEEGDGSGLKYFGMTTKKREKEGDYLMGICNIGDSNRLWGPDIDASSTRFKSLWNSSEIISLKRKNGKLVVKFKDNKGKNKVKKFK